MFKHKIFFISLVCIFFSTLSAGAFSVDSVTVTKKFNKIDACFEATRRAFDFTHLPSGKCVCKNDATSNYPWSCSVTRIEIERKFGSGNGVSYAYESTEDKACALAKARVTSPRAIAEDNCTCGPRSSSEVFCFVKTHDRDGYKPINSGRVIQE